MKNADTTRTPAQSGMIRAVLATFGAAVRRLPGLLCSLGVASCSSAQPPPLYIVGTPLKPVATENAPPATSEASASSAEPSKPPPSVSSGSAESKPCDCEIHRFTPPNFTPPFAATAKEGDGQWRSVGDSGLGELAATVPPQVLQTTVHPHKSKGYVSMNVVAMDLGSLKLGWVIGAKDYHAEKLVGHQTPGLVPERDQANTLAVFNGGFQARHGWWGMMSDGVSIVEPRPNGCTLAIFGDESVAIAPYANLANDAARMQAFRQSPPCLIIDGALHPDLERGQRKAWAGQNADLKTRRRSAAGITRDGKTLFFAIGNETEPDDLARGLLAAGAQSALQLDINWAWARFLLVGRRDELPRLTSSLLPEALYGKSECFARPSDRDFFYVYR